MLDSFSHIFFDFDGTLCASEADIRNAWKRTIASVNLECPAFDSLFKVGPSLQEMTSVLFPEIQDDIRQKIIQNFKQFYDTSTFDETVPYPWIPRFLTKLSERGAKLYVITNKRKNPTAFLLKKCGWTNLFTDSYSPDIIADRTLKKKELIQLALNDCKSAPEKTLMVGDTAADVKAGRENGIRTAGVLWGYGTKRELEDVGADIILSEEDILKWNL